MTLIRELDTIVMDQSRLRCSEAPRMLATARLSGLVREFEELGDLAQALRAQRLYAALQEMAWDRASARHALARLEQQRALGTEGQGSGPSCSRWRPAT